LTLPAVREKIITQFGISPEELRGRILFDPNVNYLYRGISIFMIEELATQSFPSNNQRQKKAKALATEMMYRNEAYSKLIQTNFSDHIRLSMHPSINDGVKYSFQLIPGARFSPWHSCAVQFKSAQPTTMHRKDAEAAGYELVTVNNQPYYFQEA
jgi:pyoverdine/dityrosine biosynthesis protein Dit1